MKKQTYQSQYILNKVFNNAENVLRARFNTSQDYLNAVYDSSQDALRINMVGGVLPAVQSQESLPSSASDGQICPVFNDETQTIDFYEWDESRSEWVYRGGTGGGGGGAPALPEEERQALAWMTAHIDQIKEATGFEYIINIEDVVLPANGNTRITVQGMEQDIDDDLDGDNDDTTPYRIDINGYVLSVSTYPNADAPAPDRYYTRITYEAVGGGLGTSHVYLQQDEFDFFSSLPNDKNIIRIYYMTNAMNSPVKAKTVTIQPNGIATDDDGSPMEVYDVNDSDNDDETKYCLDCPGYVLGIETYASSQAAITDKYHTKIVYESDGVHPGKSHIYLSEEEYNYFASLSNGKNIIQIYYVATVFPASVTVSETQYKFPENAVEFVAVDASGNIRNITDTLDRDADQTTHVLITVNGYALDVDGYDNENEKIKKRILVKMSYNKDSDTTDIYLDRESYEFVSSMGNGRNVISIYTIGAGIGVDASRVQMADSRIDGNSESAVQNRAVAEGLASLAGRISALEENSSSSGGQGQSDGIKAVIEPLLSDDAVNYTTVDMIPGKAYYFQQGYALARLSQSGISERQYYAEALFCIGTANVRVDCGEFVNLSSQSPSYTPAVQIGGRDCLPSGRYKLIHYECGLGSRPLLIRLGDFQEFSV